MNVSAVPLHHCMQDLRNDSTTVPQTAEEYAWNRSEFRKEEDEWRASEKLKKQ